MNGSRKPRPGREFRPVNTISSQRPPEPLQTPLPSPAQARGLQYYGSDISPDKLGDSSGLFDESDFQHKTFLSTPDSAVGIQRNADSGAIYTDRRGQHSRAYTARNKMVREREPTAPQYGQPAGYPAVTPSKPNTAAPRAPRTVEPVPIDLTASPAPKFGEASPLRNPLYQQPRPQSKAPPPQFAHLFNIPKNGNRPEHHRDDLTKNRPNHNPPYRNPYNAEGVVEIARPSNSRPPTTPAAQRPVFSTAEPIQSFKPINGFAARLSAAQETVDLTKNDDEDRFDPDAAIRNEPFGAADAYAYVDSGKATENIKALLEGAFDEEEEERPRLRVRGRKQEKKNGAGGGAESLTEKLAALEVSDQEKVAEEGEEEDEEEEEGYVEGLNVRLLPHQIDGVSWMMNKEVGKKKNGVLPKGGILADDMGLGKTIQSIALILSNPRPPTDPNEDKKEKKKEKNKIAPSTGKGTLVVAPLALIKQWEGEIQSRVLKSHGLKVLVHHGPNRTKSADVLKKYDVVITTYNILASEHASCDDSTRFGCFGVNWYRVILDEAHTIKNRNAKMSQACYALTSHYRWCLSGTPMQNNLDELQSLIRFLRIEPYNELRNWKEQITGPMKNGRGGLAMKRLQFFLKAFMKRRTKDILKKDGALNAGGKPSKYGENKGGFRIVDRKVETIVAEFTPQERAFYNRLSSRAQDRLAEMMGGEKQDYIGALVLLLRLRQACNHPELIGGELKHDKDALETTSDTRSKNDRSADADDLADLLGGLSVKTKQCDVCQIDLSPAEAEAGSIRCSDCEAVVATQKKSREKHKRVKVKKDAKDSKKAPESDDDQSKISSSNSPDHADRNRLRAARKRMVVMDSDDEEDGDWVVPKREQQYSDGEAGGTDDEDAEGGGDWINPTDSASEIEGDESTDMSSFISKDDTDSSQLSYASDVKEKGRTNKNAIDLVTSDEEEGKRGIESEDEDEKTEVETDYGTEVSVESDDYSGLVASTKIRYLTDILKRETPEHKVIVFSQFTSMLDLVEPYLEQQGFVFTRYDGSMRNDHREASLNRLRNDPKTRVLLCSLKCGSLGLNLTAASRVVILEPFWNPFVEEQAIDRVHRLNQTVDVIVYRLTIADTVEERILDLQEAKRKLANAAIEGGTKNINKLSMKDILSLFRRDAEYDARHADDPTESQNIFGRTRVLESPTKGGSTGVPRLNPHVAAREAEREAARRAAMQKARQYSPRTEHAVYGRR